MAVYATKRNKIFRDRAADAAKNSEEKDYCLRCYKEGALIAKYENEKQFKCENCGYLWSVGIGAQTKSKQKNKKQQKGIVIVNKSKKEQKVNPINRKEEKPISVEEVQKNVGVIRESFQTKNIISFEYYSEKSGKSERQVEPYKLELKNNAIILWAYCLNGEGIRMFKLTSIKNVVKTEFTYEPRWEIADKLDENGKV